MSYIPLPDLSHISKSDYNSIYEPAEDTFLFLDALGSQLSFIKNTINACTFVEIGPGSGCLSSFLASKFSHCFFIGIDINIKAAIISKQTAKQNNVKIDVIRGSLLNSLQDNTIDIIIFNPPYVPSDNNELNKNNIEAAWAGGENGREVIDKLLPDIYKKLTNRGCFYLLLERQNKPKEVINLMKNYGFTYKV